MMLGRVDRLSSGFPCFVSSTISNYTFSCAQYPPPPHPFLPSIFTSLPSPVPRCTCNPIYTNRLSSLSPHPTPTPLQTSTPPSFPTHHPPPIQTHTKRDLTDCSNGAVWTLMETYTRSSLIPIDEADNSGI